MSERVAGTLEVEADAEGAFGWLRGEMTANPVPTMLAPGSYVIVSRETFAAMEAVVGAVGTGSPTIIGRALNRLAASKQPDTQTEEKRDGYQ